MHCLIIVMRYIRVKIKMSNFSLNQPLPGSADCSENGGGNDHVQVSIVVHDDRVVSTELQKNLKICLFSGKK